MSKIKSTLKQDKIVISCSPYIKVDIIKSIVCVCRFPQPVVFTLLFLPVSDCVVVIVTSVFLKETQERGTVDTQSGNNHYDAYKQHYEYAKFSPDQHGRRVSPTERKKSELSDYNVR